MKPYLLASFLVLLPLLASGQTADEKKATIAYVRSLQTKQGGFLLTRKIAAPTLRATSSSLRALRYFGGQASDLPAARAFVLSCLDEKTGGFADTPGGKPDVVTTAIGLMALVELKIPTAKYEKAAIAFMADNARMFEQIRMTAAGLETIGKKSDRAEAWLKELTREQNPDGTFGRGKGLVRDTGGTVAAILRLGGKVKDGAGIVKVLDAGQREDGGFGKQDSDTSDLETSYRVVRTYVMLEARPKRAGDLRAFVARCRNRDGGYGVVPGGPSNSGGTYFAAIILHWLGEK